MVVENRQLFRADAIIIVPPSATRESPNVFKRTIAFE
jgi:hypothetical protein